MSPHMLTRSAAALIVAFCAGSGLGTAPARAQASGCGDIQGMLVQRKAIGEKLTAASQKKKLDAGIACKGFGELVQNGSTLIKWAESNKDWCQIPDSFVESIKADHARAVGIRSKACGMVAKQAEAEKQAKSGQTGLLGGGGLTGPLTIPSGAL